MSCQVMRSVSSVSRRTVAAVSVSVRSKHTLPNLDYDYGALEPHISAEIMEIHHSKHHAAYVNNLNIAEEKFAEAQAKGDLVAAMAVQPALKFNAGGHVNHTIFWKNLSPNGGGEPEGDLMEAIQRDFGSFDQMKENLNAATIGVQGSGWGWLGCCKNSHRLRIVTCANQDMLEATTGLVPLFGIDVWEHAYYLQYQNVRPEYVKSIYNVANWNDVSERYQQVVGKA